MSGKCGSPSSLTGVRSIENRRGRWISPSRAARYGARATLPGSCRRCSARPGVAALRLQRLGPARARARPLHHPHVRQPDRPHAGDARDRCDACGRWADHDRGDDQRAAGARDARRTRSWRRLGQPGRLSQRRLPRPLCRRSRRLPRRVHPYASGHDTGSRLVYRARQTVERAVGVEQPDLGRGGGTPIRSDGSRRCTRVAGVLVTS